LDRQALFFQKEERKIFGKLSNPWVYTRGYKHFIPSGFLYSQIDNLCYEISFHIVARLEGIFE
jgi:hypothetical protein